MSQREEEADKNSHVNEEETEEIKNRPRPSLFPIRYSARRKSSYN